MHIHSRLEPKLTNVNLHITTAAFATLPRADSLKHFCRTSVLMHYLFILTARHWPSGQVYPRAIQRDRRPAHWTSNLTSSLHLTWCINYIGKTSNSDQRISNFKQKAHLRYLVTDPKLFIWSNFQLLLHLLRLFALHSNPQRTVTEWHVHVNRSNDISRDLLDKSRAPSDADAFFTWQTNILPQA